MTARSAADATATVAATGPVTGSCGLVRGFTAVYAAQIARAKVARASLLFVATLQSLGILLLLRGVTGPHHHETAQAVVAGSTVLVVAFVALNLLAQRLGALRGANALDYYGALPVPPAAVVLGLAASYASFTFPGVVVTAVVGAATFGLAFTHLWVLVPVAVLAGASLAGVGAVLGLALPRPELATMAGQLGMTLVLFVGIIPPANLPAPVVALRDVVPSTYAVDALAESFTAHPDWAGVGWRLAVCAAVAVVTLAAASAVFRRVVRG